MSSADSRLPADSVADTPTRAPRYVIGIDLGTTNSAMCWVDTEAGEWTIETFPVPQIVAAGEVEALETLPSFHYEALPEECGGTWLKLPWHTTAARYVVGAYARDHGRSVAGRMIESAKSWLCHPGVDRRAALLPWHGAPDVQRLSPVEASARYLRHLREAWDAAHPQAPLQQQDVVLTIPASFDEVARELTVTAARMAGLPSIVLIEEPQAAFYAWVHAQRDSWESHVAPGQRILVCDIGGGTTDFSLIHVRSGQAGKLQFHRVAVGDHLLLGGDNLDLALAHHIETRLAAEQRLPDGRLNPQQWSQLLPACRHAKETLLSEQAPPRHTIVLSGSGARLIGGSLQVEVTRDELLQLIIDGFLPTVRLEDQPARRQSGFQEFGLPYAADPAITRYLAAFLRNCQQAGSATETGVANQPLPAAQSDAPPAAAARPDIILFNGGFFASPALRARLIDCIRQLFCHDDPDWSPLVLKNGRLDLAVAQGAAYFGMVRRGCGVRIVAGLARTYYVGVERADGTPAALCLIAAGTEPSAELQRIPHEFEVRTDQPVEFPILVSGTRLTDQPGQLLDYDPGQMSALPPIRTVLTSRRRGEAITVTAQISVRLTEIGTLDLWCVQTDGARRWQLQFDVRSATETDRTGHGGAAEQSGIVDQEIVQTATQLLRAVFGPGSREPVDGLPRRIAEAIGIQRADWPPSLLRALWAELIEQEAGRRRSAAGEARWLNLAGYCLRPGFGMAADDWRVEETWKILKGRLVHGGAACLAEWRILCRRIAGGLSAGRQIQLASPVLSLIRQKHRQVVSGRGKAADYASSSHEAAEIWRMLGSLELLEQSTRAELGGIIVDLLPRPVAQPILPALIWALGRLGARVPVYGPLNLVLPTLVIRPWILHLLQACDLSDSGVQLALMQLCRRTDDRYRDIDPGLRQQVLTALTGAGARPHLLQLVREGGTLEGDEAGLVFGEALPRGLKLR